MIVHAGMRQAATRIFTMNSFRIPYGSGERTQPSNANDMSLRNRLMACIDHRQLSLHANRSWKICRTRTSNEMNSCPLVQSASDQRSIEPVTVPVS
jgi:hypothetical protein